MPGDARNSQPPGRPDDDPEPRKSKGNALITETNDLLKKVGGLVNYAGPIEGFHVFAEHVDVVVCDGFVGNIMVKSWESLVKFFYGDPPDRIEGDAGPQNWEP